MISVDFAFLDEQLAAMEPVAIQGLNGSWVMPTVIAVLVVKLTSLSILMCRIVSPGWGRRRKAPRPVNWPVHGCVVEARRNFDRMNDWLLSYFSDDVTTFIFVLSALPRSNRIVATVDPANVELVLTNIHTYGKAIKSFTLIPNSFSVHCRCRRIGPIVDSIEKCS